MSNSKKKLITFIYSYTTYFPVIFVLEGCQIIYFAGTTEVISYVKNPPTAYQYQVQKKTKKTINFF